MIPDNLEMIMIERKELKDSEYNLDITAKVIGILILIIFYAWFRLL